MNQQQVRDVMIIGAGPAGLSLGYYLGKYGIDYGILEQQEIGFSWQSMPDRLIVISHWWTNLLPGSWTGLSNPFAMVSKAFYHGYLQRYASKNNIRVAQHVLVRNISQENGKFRIETSKGDYLARFVVCATGYFANPYIPVMPEGNDGSLSEMHACRYVSARQVAMNYPDAQKVLLVGKRATAGQLMAELSRFGFKVDISCRSELRLRGDHTFRGALRKAAYFLYEAVKIKFQQHIKMDSYVDMEGGETGILLDTGKVLKRAGIHGIREGHALFADGTKARYDLIIYATGYRSALQYLDPSLLKLGGPRGEPETRDMESVNSANLFFIGVDNLVNFRSRYLRGIASDAKRLAVKIRARLSQ